MSESAAPSRRRWIAGRLPAMSIRTLSLVVAGGLVLVRLCFALTVPMGSAPDEPDHFVKALASSRFDLGERRGLGSQPVGSAMERLNASLRVSVDLDGRATNPTWTCNAFHAEQPATCVDTDAATHARRATTTMGTFQPYLYVVLGLPTLAITDPDTSLLATRLVVVVWTSMLTAFGLLIAGRRFGRTGLLASVIGFTPMVLYVQSTLGTSGVECASAYAMFLSGFDVLTSWGRPRRGSQALFVVSTVSLCLGRPLSVVIAGVIAALFVLGIRPSQGLERLRSLPRSFLAAAGVLGAAAVAASVGWFVLGPTIDVGPPITLGFAVRHFLGTTLPALWSGVIGSFEWLDTPIPAVAAIACWSAIVGVIASGANDRARRDSWRLALVVAATIGFGFLVDVTVFARVGGDVQGRHVLPLLQLWPLAALPYAARRSRGAERSARLAALVVAATTAVGWYAIAQREAVGVDGPLRFFGSSKWRPDSGWVLPVALLVVGLVASAVLPAVATIAPSATGSASNAELDDDEDDGIEVDLATLRVTTTR